MTNDQCVWSDPLEMIENTQKKKFINSHCYTARLNNDHNNICKGTQTFSYFSVRRFYCVYVTAHNNYVAQTSNL